MELDFHYPIREARLTTIDGQVITLPLL